MWECSVRQLALSVLKSKFLIFFSKLGNPGQSFCSLWMFTQHEWSLNRLQPKTLQNSYSLLLDGFKLLHYIARGSHSECLKRPQIQPREMPHNKKRVSTLVPTWYRCDPGFRKSRDMPGQFCGTTFLLGWYHAQKPIRRWYYSNRAHRDVGFRPRRVLVFLWCTRSCTSAAFTVVISNAGCQMTC